MKVPVKVMKVAAILLLIIAAVGGYFYIFRNEISTDDATIEGRTVTISPKVQGYVKNLYVQDNQEVKAGTVLLEIDPTDYIIRRDKAKAVLAAAQAAANAGSSNLAKTVVAAPSGVDSAQAQVAAATAAWEKSASDRLRMESLYQTGGCSKQQLDLAVATEKSDRAALDKLQADLRSAATAPNVIAAAQSTTDQLQAQVQQAVVDLAQAEADLANTKVIAAMDGRITKRSVEVGTFVQAGQQLAVLVGKEIWVVANFKETQLTTMRTGQSVEIRVDAYPQLKLTGKVESLQAGTGARFALFPAENATGNFVKVVQRVPVKITFDSLPEEAGLQLAPGMSVIPTVHTAKAGI